MDPVVSLDTPKAAVTPGESGEVTVRVLNRGTTVESYRIDVLGPARSWATAPVEPLALFPDASGEAVVKFNPPGEAGPRAGTIRVGVRVSAVSSAGGATVEEFDLVLAPMIAVTAKIAPPNSRGWRKGRHRVELTNTGNVDTAVFIEAHDPDELLGCRLPQEAIVPAGEIITVPLVVSPLNGSKLIGRPSAFPFEVEVFPSGGQAVALRGSMRQRPLLTPQLMVAALVLVALVVGVLALGRSDPKSTAAERTQASNAIDDTEPSSSTSTTTLESTTTSTTVLGATTLPGATSTVPVAAAGGAAPATPNVARTATQTGGAAQNPTIVDANDVPQPQSEAPAPASPQAPAATVAPVATPAPTTPPPPSTPPMRLGPTFAGDGVMYAVTQDGRLLFYQDQRMDGSSNGVTGEGWAPTGGNQVGCGWGTMQHLIGGENGMLYAVNAAGQLVWYQDLYRDGARNSCAAQGGWNNAGGGDMSPGVNWSGYKQIFYGGNGILYAIDPSGNLRFCRDVGQHVSTPCPIIGTGWGDLREVFASGAPGVIYAINQNGDFLYFRDLLRNGTNNVNSGWVGPLPIGNGWQQAYKVFGGPINNSAYPSGVVYAIQPNGDLSWYQDVWQNGSQGIGGNQGWLGASTIGIGWQSFI